MRFLDEMEAGRFALNERFWTMSWNIVVKSSGSGEKFPIWAALKKVLYSNINDVEYFCCKQWVLTEEVTVSTEVCLYVFLEIK